MISSSTMAVMSSLEVMLLSLQKQDPASEMLNDLPPDLPSRPTSRARLPSVRHSLPMDFKVNSNGQIERSTEIEVVKKDSAEWNEELVCTRGCFGSKKITGYHNSKYLNSYQKEIKETSQDEVDCDDNVGYFIKKKMYVWCPISDWRWDHGLLQSTTDTEVTILLSSGNVVQMPTDQILPAYQFIIDGVADLIQLSYLNERSVLYNLKYKYSKDMIYNEAGSVLITVNPFKNISGYGIETVNLYEKKHMNHAHAVISVASATYKEMLRVVHGENVRKHILVEERSPNTIQLVHEQLAAHIYLQSAIRGWIARWQLGHAYKLNHLSLEIVNAKRKQGCNSSEIKVTAQIDIEGESSVLTDLQKRVAKAEEIMGHKEVENAALKEQLRQFERRWMEYEAKMKATEEIWRRQILSLQGSLAEAKMHALLQGSLTSQNNAHIVEKSDSYTFPRGSDLEEDIMHPGSRCVSRVSSPQLAHNSITFGTARDWSISVNALSNLSKEFDRQRQDFDDDVEALVDARDNRQCLHYTNLRKEFHALKIRFETWKKDYKGRLHETKLRLRKLGEVDKTHRKWWGMFGAIWS